eukprot:CAMPEP_0168278156 /NCGR_PEP_ID=MMETSP0141_2-20121125/19691_1 /TAXON_ID=44445 /ORGANISM="Pseudo-nitzschia australis, Strain 10249 10 AB" /LENGTH=291 /DNA_ID=CAMNT_0008220811 /DNA_START=1256 /DNA_END=2127 /DNA_ORIENTATION=+
MAKVDEMSYSGILVEKPDDSSSEQQQQQQQQQQQTGKSAVPSSEGAIFAADLTTPSVSNRSKNRIKGSTSAKDLQSRRIVKATPPSKTVATATALEENEASEASTSTSASAAHAHARGLPQCYEASTSTSASAHTHAVYHNAAPLSSPIGNNANAANELLEESIEKHDQKTKQREKVTNRQKNDRERLFQEKRKQKSGNNDKPKVQANPFSRFLSAFSVNANPKHKRKEESITDAENKRLKYGFQDTPTATVATDVAIESESSSQSNEADTTGENNSTKEKENHGLQRLRW